MSGRVALAALAGGAAAARAAWVRARRALVAGVAVALALAASGARAEGEGAVAECRVKAAFLFKFLDFIEWPRAGLERPDAPFVIGVLGARALADELAQGVAGRQVGGRPVQLRVLAHGDPPAGLQVLFVGRPESAQVPAIAAAAEGQALLVVTEAADGLAAGGGINFVVVDDKVRFDIALRPIERAGLKVSARLLTVARTVSPNP